MDNETLRSYLMHIKEAIYTGRFIEAYNQLGFIISNLNSELKNGK